MILIVLPNLYPCIRDHSHALKGEKRLLKELSDDFLLTSLQELVIWEIGLYALVDMTVL